MNRKTIGWFVVAVALCARGHVGAQLYDKKTPAPEAIALPAPGEVKALTVHPDKVDLNSSDDSRQLLLTADLGAGRLQDLSGDVKYEVADAKVVRVTSAGRVIPLANGDTTITARYGDKAVTIPVKAASMDIDKPINFTNHIVPIFTKLGCNGGGCHGKSGGQNGFALSLLGFVPELDYQALTKATGTMAHAGGKRMEGGSDEYKLIKRWIASGTPFGKDSDPTVAKITVFPEHRIIPRNNRQQFEVYAHYTDGTVLDV